MTTSQRVKARAAGKFEVIDVTGSERNRLLTLDEDHFCDVKAIQIAPAKLTRTLSAFANSSGGDTYVGIAEQKFLGTTDRFWSGFPNQEAANAHLQVLAATFPLGSEYWCEFLRSPGSPGLVLHISIQKTARVVEASDGLAYVRHGSQNLPVKTAIERERLRLDKGVHSFESTPVDVEIDFVSESAVLEQFVRDVIPASKPMKYLRSQSLIKNGKPVVTG